MGLKRKILVFSFAFSSIGGPLALVGQFSQGISALEVILSIILFMPVTYLTYYSMNKIWDRGGLYDYVNKFTPKISPYLLYFWIFSYFLYLSYTIDYIVYWILNFNGIISYLLVLGLSSAISIIVLFERELEFLLASTIMQILFTIPIHWSLKLISPYEMTVNGVISTALLYVCITLTPFVGNGKDKEGISSVMYAYLISGALLLMDSFFSIPRLIYLVSSLSTFSLIIVEFMSLRNLLSKFNINKIYLIIAFLASTLISLIDPKEYYIYTISPSVASLYVALSIFFTSITISAENLLIRILGIISIGLMAYGFFTSLQFSSLTILIEQIASILIIFGISTFKMKRKIA
ncbi:MAG: hypothetical protein RRA45_10540 [Saccharolobus sp.]|uniref:hypothetical protein n=1 Tax=Saccharolobus sp. TaxID=2100761 RepID=UPI0028CFD01C|nr:hypothetical protein [Saccharolobus sp.]MDT7862632.1 hypothetical protein [Saccharolobus sp.]